MTSRRAARKGIPQNQALLEKVLRHMNAMFHSQQHGGILLTGDPGVGKTTFVEMMGALLGIKVVVIEVPHITEEHLINIPFITFNPATNQTSSGNTQLEPAPNSKEYKLVLAKSNIFTQITSAKPLTDEQYLQYITTKAPPVVQALYQRLGGTETSIPKQIQTARASHNAILFLDEYYRHTSVRIRNILRGILNGKIGMHQIPSSAYTIYASNMRDQGLEEIASNAQFTAVNFPTPGKDNWFDYLVAKYEKDEHVQMNKQVVEKFKKLLKDEHMSFTDAELEQQVRTSPRRWEQLMMYINTSIPPKDLKSAKSLMTNVKNNFIHYQTKQHSKVATQITNAVAELIKETSGIDVDANATNDEHNWRDSLEHMVEQQMKMNGKMKYIPVVSGPPGIGKTSHALAIAAEHNMRLIDIDVSELNADDVIGMPLPGERKGDEMDVSFSVPKLYRQIQDQITSSTQAYYNNLKQRYGDKADEYIKKFENQRWKYLIFFDELTRADEKTFNALRRVILEKNFGPAGDDSGKLLKLPKGSLVIAAMNPEGVGTSELTHHFQDSIVVIPANASWQQLSNILSRKHYEGVPDEIRQVAMNVLTAFVHKFKSQDGKHSSHTAPFHIDVGTELYISPREYTDMFSTLVREINSGLNEILQDPDIKDNEMREDMDDVVAEALEDSLKFIFYKHSIEPDEFMLQLEAWVASLDDKVYGGALTKKASNMDRLSSALKSYLNGKSLSSMPDDPKITSANNSMSNGEFIEEMRQVFDESFTDTEHVRKYIIDQNHKRLELEGDEIIEGNEPASLLTNFILALLYTLHIHESANDRLIAVGKGLSTAASQTIKKLRNSGQIDEDTEMDAIEQTTELRSELHSIIADMG